MPNRDAATGRFTSGSSSGGFNLGSAYASIQIDSSGIADGISKAKRSVSEGMADIGQTLTSLGSSMTLLGAPFLAFGAMAVKSFSESQDALAQLDIVLRSTSSAAGVTRDQAIELSKAFEQETKFSDEAVLGAENLLLTFTNIGKDVFPLTTQTVLDMSQALGQDLKSSSIQLGKALQDPIKGIQSLRRVGVNFTDAQKDMIEQLVKAGKAEDAQRLILNELQKEFGGSAVAAGETFSGQLVILQNKFDDLLETIGEKLIPILDTFTGWLSQAVDWFNALDPSVQDIIIGIGAFMASLAIIGPIIAVVGAGISALGGIIAGLGAVIGILFSPIGLLIGAIVALYLAFQSNFLGIRDFLQPIFDAISNFFAHFADNVKLYGSLILLYAQYYFQGVVTEIQKIIKGIQDFVAANPEFTAAVLLIGGVVVVLTGILAAVPVVMGLVSTAAGILTGALSILLSPAVLLIAAIAGIVYAADKLYPGGLAQLFHDASVAAKELAILGLGALVVAAQWAHDRLVELLKPLLDALQAMERLQAIIQGLQGGQITAGDVMGAINNQVQSGAGGGSAASRLAVQAAGGVQPIPPVGGGSSLPLNQQGNNGMSIGAVHVYANDAAGGKAAGDAFSKALEDRYRGRGNLAQ